MKKNILRTIILFSFIFTAITICIINKKPASIAPFTDIVWGNSLDDIQESEGDSYEKSLSMSGGYNYIYPKQYLETDGYVQYNINDNGILCGISWFYITNVQQNADEIYSSIQKDTSSYLGKENSLDTSNIYTGKKWETNESNIILISFSQNNEYAVQISYLLKE